MMVLILPINVLAPISTTSIMKAKPICWEKNGNALVWKKVFIQKEDSVWIDLVAEGLDEKIVQRRDGTLVYITQDIGLAIDKYEEYHCDQSIYV